MYSRRSQIYSIRPSKGMNYVFQSSFMLKVCDIYGEGWRKVVICAGEVDGFVDVVCGDDAG
jgi:hypothetical protein